MRWIPVAVAMLVLAAPAAAQKNCSKGKACGNTCIAMDKVCHVGQLPAATLAPVSPPGVATSAPSIDLTLVYTVPSKASRTEVAWPWVVSFPFGSTAYQNVEACRTARYLREGKNRVFFATQTDARREGYFPSTLEKGC